VLSNFIPTNVFTYLSLAPTKTQNKGYRPTTTIRICGLNITANQATITVQCTVRYQVKKWLARTITH